jgi:hypothetical protein
LRPRAYRDRTNLVVGAGIPIIVVRGGMPLRFPSMLGDRNASISTSYFGTRFQRRSRRHIHEDLFHPKIRWCIVFPGMEGCTMGQVLHGSATTTEAIRRRQDAASVIAPTLKNPADGLFTTPPKASITRLDGASGRRSRSYCLHRCESALKRDQPADMRKWPHPHAGVFPDQRHCLSAPGATLAINNGTRTC